MHLLSLIATSDMNDRNSLGRFFSKTFLSTHMQPESLENQIDRVIKWLVENGMVIKEGESEEVRKRILSFMSLVAINERICVNNPLKKTGMTIYHHGPTLHRRLMALRFILIMKYIYQKVLQEKDPQYLDLKKLVSMKLRR